MLAERALLRTLAFALCRPTAHAFSSAYAVVEAAEARQMGNFSGDPEAAGMGSRLADYLVDLSLLSHGSLHFAPSLLASAAHSVAARALLAAAVKDPATGLAEGSQAADGVLEGLTRYTTAQLAAPVRLLRCVQRSSAPNSAPVQSPSASPSQAPNTATSQSPSAGPTQAPTVPLPSPQLEPLERPMESA